MTCPHCRCQQCTREKVNDRLRKWLANAEAHNERIAAAHQWDADEDSKAGPAERVVKE